MGDQCLTLGRFTPPKTIDDALHEARTALYFKNESKDGRFAAPRHRGANLELMRT